MESSNSPDKKKRGYRENGKTLACDVRVRLDVETAKRLAARAKENGTTRAATARQILKDALNGGSE